MKGVLVHRLFLVLLLGLVCFLTACSRGENPAGVGILPEKETQVNPSISAWIYPNNIAPQAAPSANSVDSYQYPRYIPSRAIDGDDYTSWRSQAYVWGTYFQLQWSQPATFDRIYIYQGGYYNYGENYGGLLPSQTIASLRYFNGQTYVNIYPVYPSLPTVQDRYQGRVKEFSLAIPITTTSLRVYVNTGGGSGGIEDYKVRITNIQVFGTLAPPASLDIAEPAENSIINEGMPTTFKVNVAGDVSGLTWKTSFPSANTPIGSGAEIPVDSLATNPATNLTDHVITVSGTTQAGTTVSDSITVKVLRLREIKIQSNGVTNDTYPVSYRAAKTPFNAIGVYADDSEKNLPVIWSLIPISGQPSSQDSMRAKILIALNQEQYRPTGLSDIPSKNIGTLCDVTGKCGIEEPSSPSLKTSSIRFVSFLSGQIRLQASLGESRPSKTITIRIKQPNVFLNFNVIMSLEPLPSLPESFSVISTTWGMEEIFHFEPTVCPGASYVATIPYSIITNQTFAPPDVEVSSEQQLLDWFHEGSISFLNPLVNDMTVNENAELDPVKINEGKPPSAITRQAKEIFSKNHQSGINFYYTQIPRKETAAGAYSVAFIEGLAHSFHSDAFIELSGSKINESLFSGVILQKLDYPFPLKHERKILAHEIGHMLMHGLPVGEHDVPDDNLMFLPNIGTPPDEVSEILTASQFISALGYLKTEFSNFIEEE